jgi:hypothetical protein
LLRASAHVDILARRPIELKSISLAQGMKASVLLQEEEDF